MINISVIIPIYNKESRIKYSIESVLSQTYENFELILINDGSTDQSGKIAKEYSFIDKRIRYIDQINQGVSKARNKGIEIAKGKYITFLDADDEWDREFLKDMISSINGSNACYCGHYFIRNNDKIKPKIKFLEGDIIESYLYNRCTPNTNSWLINKEYLNEHNIRFCDDLKLGEDMIFFSKVLIHEKNVRCISKYLSQYHKSEKNCLTEDNINKIYEDLIWMERLEEYIEKNEVDEHRKKSV